MEKKCGNHKDDCRKWAELEYTVLALIFCGRDFAGTIPFYFTLSCVTDIKLCCTIFVSIGIAICIFWGWIYLVGDYDCRITEATRKQRPYSIKEAKHNYPFAGGKHVDLKDRRWCVLGYIVALANEKGGRLVLGMVDHMPHAVVGSDFAEKEVGELTDEIYKRLGIRIEATELYEDGKRLLVLSVPSRPVGRLLRFEGVPLMRTGESLRAMFDAEIFRILSEQEPDFSAKICEGLTIEDLDKEAIAEMKNQYARKQENPLFQNYPDEQVLSDLDLLKDGKLNYAALILLGKSEAIRKYLPQNNIVVEFRTYHSMIQDTARKEFQLPLFIAIDKVWDYINQPASNPLLHYNDGPLYIRYTIVQQGGNQRGDIECLLPPLNVDLERCRHQAVSR